MAARALSVHPSTPDRELTLEQAAAAIHDAVPELAGADVRLLGEGWDFDAYEAGGYVFRFPRREKEQARLRAELVVLPWIAHAAPLPVPRYAWGELRSDAFPYVFSGYPKLEGVNASKVEPDSVDFEALGRSLGAFFRALHAVDVPYRTVQLADLDKPGMGPAERRDNMRDRFLARFRARVPAMAARAEQFFADPALLPPDYEGPGCLLHDDLHAEHLLLTEDRAGIAGVIDWSDLWRGDPARDPGYIYSWGGQAMLAGILEGYAPDDPDFEARARFHGTCVAFLDWDCYVRDGITICEQATLHTLDAALPR